MMHRVVWRGPDAYVGCDSEAMGDGVGGSSKKLHRGGGSAGVKEGECEDGLLKPQESAAIKQ